jgi:SAM-dependent methyltransferase
MTSSPLPRPRPSASDDIGYGSAPLSAADPYLHLAGVYDEIVVDPCHPRWAAFVDGLWSGERPAVHTVLDVCCGTGLMSAELVALGYRVSGVDGSAAMLAHARRRLGPGIPLAQATLPDLGDGAAVDAAVSTLDGFNYLTPDTFRSTLAALAARLRPGGWCVFDLHTDAMMAFAAERPVITGEANGRRFTITNTVDTTQRTCDSRIDVIDDRGGASFSEHHLQHFFSDRDVYAALVDAGFHVRAITDEYTHDPVGPATLRATWVARRSPVPTA